MRLGITVLFLSAFISSPALATRPYVSMEEIFERSPIIFEGTVKKIDEVNAPTHDFYLYNQENALVVQFETSKAWKGLKVKPVTVYTWPLGKAPCTGVTIESGKNYILWAEWDTKKQYILFDYCRGFMSSDSISSKEIRDQLNHMFDTKN